MATMIFHAGTETLISADHAVLVELPDSDLGLDLEAIAAQLERDGEARPVPTVELVVEVSAVRGWSSNDKGIETCNDEPATAEAFGVYIRNPMALHIEDFGPDGPDGFRTLREARHAASRFALILATHIGGTVSEFAPAADAWPSCYVVQPVRDWNRDDDLADDAGTDFRPCEEDRAEQWALMRLDVDGEGVPVTGTADLVDDYPTREAAEAAAAALDHGEARPLPAWSTPAAAAPIASSVEPARVTITRGDGWSSVSAEIAMDAAVTNALFAAYIQTPRAMVAGDFLHWGDPAAIWAMGAATVREMESAATVSKLRERGYHDWHTGGGCLAMRRDYQRPLASADAVPAAYVLVTDEDGADMPTAAGWLVGVYDREGDDVAPPFESGKGHGDLAAALEKAERLARAVAFGGAR